MTNSLHLPHQLTPHIKLLHKVGLVYQGKVLILKRADNVKSRPSKWDLPGGNSEWPQNIAVKELNPHQQDVAREIEEETGLKIAAADFTLKNLIYFSTYFEPNKQIFSINCGWQAVLTDDSLPQITISNEHTEYVWITLSELENYDFGGPERDYETKIIREILSEVKN
jgi:8-oxo-dGTP diphosphatase